MRITGGSTAMGWDAGFGSPVSGRSPRESAGDCAGVVTERSAAVVSRSRSVVSRIPARTSTAVMSKAPRPRNGPGAKGGNSRASRSGAGDGRARRRGGQNHHVSLFEPGDHLGVRIVGDPDLHGARFDTVRCLDLDLTLLNAGPRLCRLAALALRALSLPRGALRLTARSSAALRLTAR